MVFDTFMKSFYVSTNKYLPAEIRTSYWKTVTEMHLNDVLELLTFGRDWRTSLRPYRDLLNCATLWFC